MKKVMISTDGRVRFIALLILLCAPGVALAEPKGDLKLNKDAFAFAARLIKEGHFVADSKGEWREHQPSTKIENEFIRLHGFVEYAQWHLGIDSRYPDNTKSRCKFPYGDFENVHRCGLLAAKARARQYGHTEIENAVIELEGAIQGKPLTLPSR